VRDFTEVGWMNLSKTYTRVGAMMAIKKDAWKEED
jgi:hypothetical protein